MQVEKEVKHKRDPQKLNREKMEDAGTRLQMFCCCCCQLNVCGPVGPFFLFFFLCHLPKLTKIMCPEAFLSQV